MSDFKTFIQEVDNNQASKYESGPSTNLQYTLDKSARRLLKDIKYVSLAPTSADTFNVQNNSFYDVSFQVSSSNFVDPRSVHLRGFFTVNGLGAATDRCYLEGGFVSLLNQIQVNSYDGTQIDAIEGSDLLGNVYTKASLNENFLQTTGDQWFCAETYPTQRDVRLGAGDPLVSEIKTVEAKGETKNDITACVETNVNNALAALFPSRYNNRKSHFVCSGARIPFSFPLSSVLGIFNQPKLLPMPFLKSITINLRFNRPVSALTCNANRALTYTISNLRMEMAQVRVHDGLLSKIRERIEESGNLMIPFNAVYHQMEDIGVSGSKYLVVNKACTDAQSAFAVLRNVAEIDNIQNSNYNFITDSRETKETILYDKDINMKKPPQWSWAIGGQNLPVESVISFQRSKMYLAHALGRYLDTSYAALSMEEYENGSFIIGMPLESDSSTSFTGVSTTNNLLALNLDKIHENSPAAALSLRLDVFLLHTKILVLKKDGIEMQE